MFATLFTVALAASSVSAAPLLQERKEAPSTWAEGYLEDYQVYHNRYIALSCQNKHDDQGFFNECCRPLLASENLYEARPSRCIPGEDASASASARIAANAQQTGSVPASNGEQPDDAASQGANFAAAEPPKEEHKEEAKPAEEEKKEEPKQENQGGNAVRTFNNGQATHFTPWDGTGISFSQEPQPGHCGYNWNDYGGLGGNWVALKSSLYNGGEFCGKQVRITSKDGATAVGTILDSCPSCHEDGHIDISPSMFNQLQNIVTIPTDSDEQPSNDPGVLDVTWEILA